MALRTPGQQQRSQYHHYWGVYTDATTDLPNQSGNPLATSDFTLEAGDVAYSDGNAPGLYVCDDPGTAGGGDAIWSLTGGAASTARTVQSDPGAYTAPIGSAVGDLVRISAADTIVVADQSAGLPANGIIVAKPTGVTATVAYLGEVTVPVVLTGGTAYYLGASGALTSTPPDPIALAGTGTISQRVGIAKDASTLILKPDTGILL